MRSHHLACQSYQWLTTPVSAYEYDQGRTHGGRGGARDLPWDLKNTIFSGFPPLNYVICIFEICLFKLFAMWED